jgi:subtilisin family serine protease
MVEALGAKAEAEISAAGLHVVSLPEGVDEEFYVQAFKSQSDVEFAELDRVYSPQDMVPDDPEYSVQWHLSTIAAPTAWATTTGSAGVTIAILDSGVDPNHPDLAGKLVPGWNTYDENSNTADVYGHGTAVAGTAAALSNNAQGVSSVAWGCSIMPVRVSDTLGYAFTSTIASGLVWAADHGARVANISFAATNSSAVTNAAQYFQSRGGIVTVSAGNEASFDSTADNKYVLTVSGSTSSDSLASWSNTGNNIDLSAPGAGIRTTNRGGGYGWWSGTSFSAPVVAGVAALVMSANPGLTAPQVQSVIKQSADDLGTSGWDTSFGAGRVNAAAAIALAISTAPPSDNPPTIVITSPRTDSRVLGPISVYVDVTDDHGVRKVELYVDGMIVSASNSAPFTTQWNAKKIAKGPHRLKCLAYDIGGNISESEEVVVIR